MSLSSAVLKALVDAGATREQLAAAMMADIAEREAEETAKLEKKRAGNRERQQRKRERDHAESRVTSVTARDERDVSPDGSPKEYIQTPSLAPSEKPKPNGLVKKVDRGCRLPSNWEPQPLVGKAAAMVAAWQAGALERELAKFKNYWAAKGANAARTDWQRTWVNWLISADERKPRQSYERPDSDPTTDALRIAIYGTH